MNEKYSDNYSDILMSDPEKDIRIGIWNNEHELREKADIHRARLNKYGRSKINGELILYFFR